MDDPSENPPVTDSPVNQENYGEGKLWIKLDFTETEESDPIEAKSDDQVRVCMVCNKGFSSGKALGGHMRVHAQENRDNSTKISKKPVKMHRISMEKSQHLVFLSENPDCPLCDKSFRSIKSLFGHMRCHPEREYRGICPPQTGPNHLSSSSSVSDERETSNPTFPTWSATAKRGRRALIPATATSSSSGEYCLSEEDKEAVYDLMSLAQGEFFVPDLRLSSNRKIEATNSNSLVIGAEVGCKDRVFESKKRKIGDLGYGSKGKELRINKTVPFEGKSEGKSLFGSSQNSFSDDEFGGKDSGGSISSNELITNLRPSKKKVTTKIPKFRDLKSVENNGDEEYEYDNNVVEKEFKCSTCNKCFPSHQALGGHRSSHNKSKKFNQTLNSDTFAKYDISRGDETKDSNTIESVDPIRPVATHTCKICQKSFPTGQALGGHKRCHWEGPTEGPLGPVSSAMSSPGEEASRTRVLGLDLNEPPLIEDEDGGVESHNDG